MRSLRKYLFRSDVVSLMFVAQALIDGFVVGLITRALVHNKIVTLQHGLDMNVLFSWAFVTIWILSTFIVSLTLGITIVNRRIFYRQILLTLALYAIFLAVLFGSGEIELVAWRDLGVFYMATALGILLFRTAVFGGYKLISMFSRGRRIIIIGCNHKSSILHHNFINHEKRSLTFLGFFDHFDPGDEYFEPYFKGYLEDVKAFCVQHRVSEIYYTLSDNKTFLNDLSDFADQNFIFLGIVPDVELKERKRMDTTYVGNGEIPVITYRYSPLQNETNYWVKRIFDICFSGAVLIVLIPTILPLIAVAIKLDSRGPVFFVQKRPGRNTLLFDCYKFRTMYVNGQTERAASKNDPRVTRLGAFLRKTSLDELPQFFNVLKGDMSIVGPRPNLVTHLNVYTNRTIDYSLRHTVTPGITGYAQISGCRGEVRDHASMEKRVEFDMKYMKDWSFYLDIKIILKTIFQVVKGDEKAY